MATLDRKTKKLLYKLTAAGNPSKKSSKKAELSSETLSVLTELEEPSKKDKKKHKTSISTKTKSMIDKLQKPGKHSSPKGQKSVSSETAGLISELSRGHKSIRSKKTSRKNKITSVTRRAIANLDRPKKSTGSVKHNALEPETRIALLNLQAIPPVAPKPRAAKDIDKTTRQILRDLVTSDDKAPYKRAYDAVLAGAESPSKIFDKHSLTLKPGLWDWLKDDNTDPEPDTEGEDDRKVRVNKGVTKATGEIEKFRKHLLLYPTDEILSVLEYDFDGHNSGLLLGMILESSSQIDCQLFSGVLDLCVSKLHQPQKKLKKDDGDYLPVSFLAYIINKLCERHEAPELFGLIEPHLHILHGDDKEFLSKQIYEYIQFDYSGPKAKLDPSPNTQTYLDLIRKIRFTKDHLKRLAENSFGLMNAYETNWNHYITNFGEAAGAAGVAGTGAGVTALLLLSTGIGAVIAPIVGAATFLVVYKQQRIRTMGEYKRHKMICETLWRSATERGFSLERDKFQKYGPYIFANNEEYGWRVDPRSIREKCLRYNKELKEHALEVEKLKAWWQTSCQRTLNNEEETGDDIHLPGPDESLVVRFWHDMADVFKGQASGTPDKAGESIIIRIDKVSKDMGKAVSELIKLKVDLEVAKHYWNLDDVHADVDLAKRLVSDCAMYKNILDYFDKLSDKKFENSKKRTQRSLKIKRQESNEIAKRISTLTTAVNNNTTIVSASLTTNQVDIRNQFSKAESAFENNREKIAEAKTEAAAARAAAEQAARDARRAGGKAPGTFGAMGDGLDGMLGS